MGRGLDRDIILAHGVTKKAWKIQKKRNKAGNKSVKSTKKQVKVNKKPKKRVNRTAKKKVKRRRKFTVSVAVVVPFLSKFMSAGQHMINGDMESARKDLLWHFALIDSNGKFNSEAIKTWYPVVFGMGIHWLASKFGINRALGRAGVPLFRI